ncbi:MAG TPA: hypothetical protein VNB95_05790, partial [Nitrososphaera sp.]|nr:hypothetical protein [Nitrososphaera sp.]
KTSKNEVIQGRCPLWAQQDYNSEELATKSSFMFSLAGNGLSKMIILIIVFNMHISISNLLCKLFLLSTNLGLM